MFADYNGVKTHMVKVSPGLHGTGIALPPQSAFFQNQECGICARGLIIVGAALAYYYPDNVSWSLEIVGVGVLSISGGKVKSPLFDECKCLPCSHHQLVLITDSSFFSGRPPANVSLCKDTDCWRLDQEATFNGGGAG